MRRGLTIAQMECDEYSDSILVWSCIPASLPGLSLDVGAFRVEDVREIKTHLQRITFNCVIDTDFFIALASQAPSPSIWALEARNTFPGQFRAT